MVVETSTTPGSAIAAAMRCSNATARGTQWPPWLTPITATRAASTSARAARASTTGVSTFSQSGRNGMPCRISAAFCPGPSKVMAFQPRSSASAMPRTQALTTDPSATVVVDQRAAGLVGGAGAEEVAGQGGVLVGNRDALDVEGSRLAAQVDEPVPGAPVVLPQRGEEGRVGGGVGLVGGFRVVVRGAQVLGGGGTAASGAGVLRGLRGEPVRGGRPLLDPGRGLAVGDVVDGREYLADVGGSVEDATEDVLGGELEVVVGEERPRTWTARPSSLTGILADPAAACRSARTQRIYDLPVTGAGRGAG